MQIDTRIMTEDIIRVGLKKRKKNPKERNVIDIRKETLSASNVAKRDILVDTVTFKERLINLTYQES